MKYRITSKDTGKTDIVEAEDKQDLLDKWDVSDEFFDIEAIGEEKTA